MSNPAEQRPAAEQRPLFIVVNAGSGAAAGAAKVGLLHQGFGRSGRRYQLLIARRGRAIARIAEQAASLARQHDGVLVVAGGDGTINAVGRLAVRDQLPFGIVPEGTFNYLSRAHGIPQDAPAAIECVLGGVIREVQAGLLNDRMFFVNGSVGLYPKLLEDREAYKRRYGRNRLVATWSAVVTLLHQSRQLEIDLTADGETRHRRTPTLFVANNRLQLEQVGIADAAALDAGQLVAITAAPLGIGSSLKLMARGFLGRLGDAPEVSSFAFRSMTVTIGRGRRLRRIKVATDGEIGFVHAPLQFRTSPKPLRLIVPAEAAVGTGSDVGVDAAAGDAAGDAGATAADADTGTEPR
ncbi:MAG: diacylglycerol kinase family protein [Lautropia sp.]